MKNIKLDTKFLTFVTVLVCLFVIMWRSDGEKVDALSAVIGVFAPSVVSMLCVFWNERPAANSNYYEAPKLLCEHKRNGKMFVAYKNKEGYRFAPYKEDNEPTDFSKVNTTEFHNLFKTIDRPKTPRVSPERMRRMGLSDES